MIEAETVLASSPREAMEKAEFKCGDVVVIDRVTVVPVSGAKNLFGVSYLHNKNMNVIQYEYRTFRIDSDRIGPEELTNTLNTFALDKWEHYFTTHNMLYFRRVLY